MKSDDYLIIPASRNNYVLLLHAIKDLFDILEAGISIEKRLLSSMYKMIEEQEYKTKGDNK